MPTPPFDWNSFLVYAQTIVPLNVGEAAYRIATSRAYYATYWKARQLLEAEGITFPRMKTHDFCWNSFSAVYTKGSDQICKLGTELKVRRVHADYEDAPAFSQKAADSDVQDAAELIAALGSLTDQQKSVAVARANQILSSYRQS